jgi:uncharacterized protein YlxP (DUF503 family)
MFVGVMRLGLSVVGARSLKDKRRVVHSLKDRLATRLRVSVAEIGELDDPRRAHLGVAVVSNEAAQCDRVLEEVAHYASTLGDALLTDRATEIVPFGEAGRSVRGGIEAWALDGGAAPDEGEDDDAEH